MQVPLFSYPAGALHPSGCLPERKKEGVHQRCRLPFWILLIWILLIIQLPERLLGKRQRKHRSRCICLDRSRIYLLQQR